MYGETRPTDILGWDRFLVEVVREFAEEHSIKLDLLSGGWIMRLEKDSKVRFIFGLDLGLNNSTSKLLARDKSATSDVLELEDIPHIPHKLFLRPESLASNPDGNWESIVEYFNTYKQNVVCKPNLGSSGLGVEQATSQASLEKVVQNLFAHNRSISISPFVAMNAEYRVTVLNSNVELIYKKIKENQDDLKFNLCKGAYAEEVTNKGEIEKISQLAVQAASAIGINFANVDIALSASGLEILEINSGVMFEHYVKQGSEERERARQAYRNALSTLF